MRFFDEDNHQFQWTMALLSLAAILYTGSFVVLRDQNTLPCEWCGCQYEWVDFPKGPVRILYAPLIAFDERLTEDRYSKDD